MNRADIDAVLLDAGGVLLVPDPAALATIFGPHGGDADEATIIRAHYAAITAADDGVRLSWDRYLEVLADNCGVGDLAAAAAAHGAYTAGNDLWNWPLPGARDALERLAAEYRVAVVSNAEGTIAAKLAGAGICHVGPAAGSAGGSAAGSAGVPVEIIVDSHVVGVEKPDPAIFAFALEPMGLDPARCVYVGDTRFADVAGARAAGMIPLHLDPYGLCPAPAGHAHATGMTDVADQLTG